MISGEDLKMVLNGKSDFPKKHGGEPNDLPAMMFNPHDCDLYDSVRPIRWKDPSEVSVFLSIDLDAQTDYHMVVIGGGAGGLVTAANSVSYGIKVALIEKNLLGGDCLNTGCVPSKAFLKCANVAHNARNSSAFGVTVEEVNVNFPVIMERMRKIRA